MILKIVNPTKMRVFWSNDEEHSRLVKALTYKNTSVAYQIKMTKQMAYKYGEIWAANRVAELEGDLNETLLYQDEEGYYTRPGLVRYLEQRFQCKAENLIEYPEFRLIPWSKTPENEPYPYQLTGRDRLIQIKHGHIECATGTGKSYIIELLVKEAGLPTVISTPSKSIARQLYEELTLHFGKAKVGLFGDGKDEVGKHILVAIGKSLSLVKEPEDITAFQKYQVFISDESHTLPADQFDYYSNVVLGHCPYRWFVSGTQERSDGTDLKLLSIIGPQVLNYSIQQAISDGYLAKLSFLVFNVQSLSNYQSNNLVRMNQAHLYENERIAQVIALLTAQAVEANMPVLILIDEHVQEKLLQAYMKVDYVYASGKTKTHEICRDFNDGKIMCVVGNSAVSTGTNFRPVRLTINWQANKAAVKVKQGPIGRSTRIDKKTGKTDCKVVDFRIMNVDTLRRHANERIKYYSEIVQSYDPPEEVLFADFEAFFEQINTLRQSDGL